MSMGVSFTWTRYGEVLMLEWGDGLADRAGRPATDTEKELINALTKAKLGDARVERSPSDYAIEFGGYLAKAPKDYMDACNVVEEARARHEESEPGVEAGAAYDVWHAAEEARSDHWSGLRNAIYEFEKRRDRALADVPSNERGQWGDPTGKWEGRPTSSTPGVAVASDSRAGAASPRQDIPSHEAIAEMLPTLQASSACPLCGQSGFHTHGAGEIVIYRNGVKYGRSLSGSAPVGACPSNESLRRALRFYARGHHMLFDDAAKPLWESVSGEPENWLQRENEGFGEMIESGEVAAMALRGEPLTWEGEVQDGEEMLPIEDEIMDSAPKMECPDPSNDQLAIEWVTARLVKEREKWTTVTAKWTQDLYAGIHAIRLWGTAGIKHDMEPKVGEQ